MKLFHLLTLVFVVTVVSAEANTWLPIPQNIIDAFSNKTHQLGNFIKERGKGIKRFYVQNVRSKIQSYLGRSSTPVNENREQVRIRRKHNEYGEKNNEKKMLSGVIPKMPQYKHINDDPMITLTTPEMISANGYPAESHTIVTEDGYILTVHRIPHSKRSGMKMALRKTVLLHHGLLGSSADWVLPGPKKGLAYILADAGYDVWLANVRGNTYSRAHVSRKIDSFAYWNFTFHEVSQYDVPAVIDHIMDLKGWDVKINYIGHSMGTTILFAMLSTKTQYNKVLRAGFALAPVAYMTEVESPLKVLAKFSNNIEYLMKLLGANEFLPQSAVIRWLSKHACEINHYEEAICENSLFVLLGYDSKEFNKSLLPVILSHTPAGASTKTLIHYAQEIKSNGRFQQFDYGPEENEKLYGSLEPPEYPINKITLPIALFSSENDKLSGELDVSHLYMKLPNPIEHYIVPLKEFNHIDFLWAVDAPKLVYYRLLHLLEDGVGQGFFNPDVVPSNDIH